MASFAARTPGINWLEFFPVQSWPMKYVHTIINVYMNENNAYELMVKLNASVIDF